jgi:hypothetical protein
MSVRCNHSTLVGTCGVGLIYGFESEYGNAGAYDSWKRGNTYKATPVSSNSGGAGWQLAGFVKTPICEAAYNELKQAKKIVFQSPVRTNSNSGRKFFTVMYDTKREKTRPAWVGKRSGAPKPQALIDWEAAPTHTFQPEVNNDYSWPFRA